MLIQRGQTYNEVYQSFKWNIPEIYNIADDVCDRWAADPARIALVYEDENKQVQHFSFADVKRYANQFANTLRALGLKRGERVTLLLAQDPEAAIGHVACWKAGLVSNPTSVLFGPEGLASGRSPDRLDALVWAVTALVSAEARGEPRVRGV